MRNIQMTVSYDGTFYNGFQTQPQKNTVQDKLEDAIRKLTGETLKIHASGRTDAGVHARGQVFNFATHSRVPVNKWALAMNARLPHDIVVYDAEEVPLDFHARRCAVRKTYRYSINMNRYPDVYRYRYELHHPTPLNVEAMEQALSHLIGEHDFTTFCSRRSTKSSHIRTLYHAKIIREPAPHPPYKTGDPGVIHIEICGNGFLYNMVRIIVGTLLEVGRGKRSSHNFADILAAKDRSLAGPTAEAHGLMLWEVGYNFLLDCRPELL